MCTRFVLEQTRIRALLTALGLDADGTETTGPVDRHNIAPGTAVAALRSAPAGLAAFRPRWGFTPYAASDGAPLVNARAETLAPKPSFRDAFRRRRCLVPATGFYEWEKRGRARLPGSSACATPRPSPSPRSGNTRPTTRRASSSSPPRPTRS